MEKVIVAEWTAPGRGLTAGCDQVVYINRSQGRLILKYEGWSATGSGAEWRNKFANDFLPDIPQEIIKTAPWHSLAAYILYGYTPQVAEALDKGLLPFPYPYPGDTDLKNIWGLMERTA